MVELGNNKMSSLMRHKQKNTKLIQLKYKDVLLKSIKKQNHHFDIFNFMERDIKSITIIQFE